MKEICLALTAIAADVSKLVVAVRQRFVPSIYQVGPFLLVSVQIFLPPIDSTLLLKQKCLRSENNSTRSNFHFFVSGIQDVRVNTLSL